MICPAPRNPIPVTTAAIARAPESGSGNAYIDTETTAAVDMHTII